MNTAQRQTKINAILANQTITKTERIRQLLALNLSRLEVTELTGGNYGFVQNVFAKYWPERVESRTFRLTQFNSKFGVEIEAYGVDRNTVINRLTQAGLTVDSTFRRQQQVPNSWKVVGDSSVTGDYPFEIVSPILKGQEGLNQLKTACLALSGLNVKINKSCGLHVHFDASTIGGAQLQNLLINYIRYEPIIDSLMAPSRRANNNTYCKSLISHESNILTLEPTKANLTNAISNRYYKVNLQSLARHGSIEFRQHAGTVNYTKIENWILFLHNLIHYSKFKQIDRSNATFESLRKINQAEVFNYLQIRKNQLAA